MKYILIVIALLVAGWPFRNLILAVNELQRKTDKLEDHGE